MARLHYTLWTLTHRVRFEAADDAAAEAEAMAVLGPSAYAERAGWIAARGGGRQLIFLRPIAHPRGVARQVVGQLLRS